MTSFLIPLSAFSPFQSTPSSRRVTVSIHGQCFKLVISIHTLLAESDRSAILKARLFPLFQSTPSSRRVTRNKARYEFQSTPSSRRVTTGSTTVFVSGTISIHTLLAESDPYQSHILRKVIISIHTLLAESDSQANSPLTIRPDFNPHPPRGE